MANRIISVHAGIYGMGIYAIMLPSRGFSVTHYTATLTSDGHVSEEEPSTDEVLLGSAGRLVHDVQVGRVEAEGGGGQTVSDQVDPEQLDGDQGLGHAQRSRQEDTDHNKHNS